MAVENEFYVPPPKPLNVRDLPIPSRSFEEAVDLNGRCEIRGQIVPAIRVAVDVYAREHLLDDIEKLGLGTPDAVVRPGMKESIADGLYDLVEIDARDEVGRLFISQTKQHRGRSGWAATIVYCLHVHRQRGAIEVVIEELMTSIS